MAQSPEHAGDKRPRLQNADGFQDALESESAAELVEALRAQLLPQIEANNQVAVALAASVASLKELQDSIPAKVMGLVSAKLQQHTKNFDDKADLLEAEINMQKDRITALETAQMAAKTTTANVVQRLNIAEKVEVDEYKTAISVSDFDRTPNPALLKVNVGERNARISKDALVSSLKDILDHTNLDILDFDVRGPPIGSRFTILCCKLGTVSTGDRRARTIMDYLYNNGDWIATFARNPDGEAKRIFFEKDKNPRQERTEALTRKAVAILKQLYPTVAPGLTSVHRDGKVFHSGHPLLKVVVEGPGVAHLEWDLKYAASVFIDRSKVNGQWSVAGRVDDGVEWAR